VAGPLRITDPVITEDCLRQQHRDEAELLVGSRAIITPTGWDYIRNHRLRVQHDEHDEPAGEPPADSGLGPAAPSPEPSAIPEVLPVAADGASIRQVGRFDHPDQPFGCKNDDFGSGFAEPSSGQDGDAGQAPPTPPVAGQDPSFEALVQQITDVIMKRINE